MNRLPLRRLPLRRTIKADAGVFLFSKQVQGGKQFVGSPLGEGKILAGPERLGGALESWGRASGPPQTVCIPSPDGKANSCLYCSDETVDSNNRNKNIKFHGPPGQHFLHCNGCGAKMCHFCLQKFLPYVSESSSNPSWCKMVKAFFLECKQANNAKTSPIMGSIDAENSYCCKIKNEGWPNNNFSTHNVAQKKAKWDRKKKENNKKRPREDSNTKNKQQHKPKTAKNQRRSDARKRQRHKKLPTSNAASSPTSTIPTSFALSTPAEPTASTATSPLDLAACTTNTGSSMDGVFILPTHGIGIAPTLKYCDTLIIAAQPSENNEQGKIQQKQHKVKGKQLKVKGKALPHFVISPENAADHYENGVYPEGKEVDHILYNEEQTVSFPDPITNVSTTLRVKVIIVDHEISPTESKFQTAKGANSMSQQQVRNLALFLQDEQCDRYQMMGIDAIVLLATPLEGRESNAELHAACI